MVAITPQTQKDPKHEGKTIKSENVGDFFFLPFDKINKYIDLSTIQVRAIWHIYKQNKLQSCVSKYTQQSNVPNKINTKSWSSLRYATSIENLGLPHPRLIDLKYPTSNWIDYDLIELCKIESPTNHSINLSLSIMLQSPPIKQSPCLRYREFIWKTVEE